MKKPTTPVIRQTENGPMQEIREQLPLGWYAAGVFCFLYACFFPLYRLPQLLVCGVLSAAAGVLAQRLAPVRTRLVPYTAPATGNAAVDELLQQGQQALTELRAANRALPDPGITARLDRIEAACTRIFDTVRLHPEQAAQCRKFMNYYLPTLLQLLRVRTELEQAGTGGENITASKARISAVLEQAAAAFEAFYDRLHADQAMNVNAEISVFEAMLRQEGLLKQEQPAPAAPESERPRPSAL